MPTCHYCRDGESKVNTPTGILHPNTEDGPQFCSDDPVFGTETERGLWEILVPTVKNDGKPFRLKGHHKPWDAKVQVICGGLTLMPVLNGRWSYKGTEFKERMIPVRIMATREEIERIVDMTILHYDQHAVMAYKVADEVILKHKGE